MQKIDLQQYGITVEDVRRNCSPAVLYQEAFELEKETVIAKTGALIAYSGSKTGRSPKTSASSVKPTRKTTCGGDRSTCRSTKRSLPSTANGQSTT